MKRRSEEAQPPAVDRHIKQADLILELTGEVDAPSKDQQQQEESYEERLARKQQEYDEHFPPSEDNRKESYEERLARKEGICGLSDVKIGHSMQILALTRGGSEGKDASEISGRIMGLSEEVLTPLSTIRGSASSRGSNKFSSAPLEAAATTAPPAAILHSGGSHLRRLQPALSDSKSGFLRGSEQSFESSHGISAPAAYVVPGVNTSGSEKDIERYNVIHEGDDPATAAVRETELLARYEETGVPGDDEVDISGESYKVNSAPLETAATPSPPVATLHSGGSHIRRLEPALVFSKPGFLRGGEQSFETSDGLSVPGAYIVPGMNASGSESENETYDMIHEDDDEETAIVSVRETEVDRYEETDVPGDDEVENQIQDATVEQAISTSKDIKRRHWYMLVGVLVVVIGVGAGVGVAVSSSDDGDSEDKLSPVDSPTEAPTIPACSMQSIYSQCQDRESFFLPSDIPDCAAEQYDSVRESLTTEMYSSLLADMEKTSCAPENLALLTLAANEEESTVKYILNVLYFSTNGHEWYDSTNWLSTEPECTWRGIRCSDGVVVWLELIDNNLSGSLPTMIGHLDTLQRLSLGFNILISAIPTELGNLEKLEILDLRDNPFDGGPIPTHIFSLSKLRHIQLANTHRSGTLPNELAVLSQLRTIDLESNAFSGTIPSVLFSLISLEKLVLASNDLTGTIPTEMGSLSVLTGLVLERNKLRGAMPTELGLLTTLVQLTFSYNNLSGFIPEEVCDLSLVYLGGSACQSFTTVSPSFYGGLECPSTECCEKCPPST